MSSGQLQRTPDNFPRMKHRAAGRIAKRRNLGQMPTILEMLRKAVQPFVEVFNSFASIFSGVTVQPIATRPQDWAPQARQIAFPAWVDEAFQGPYRGDLTA